MAERCSNCSTEQCKRFPVTTNFPLKTKQSTRDLRGILISAGGVGKSTLMNIVCNTERPAGESQFSMSRELVECPSAYGNGRFTLVDTPSTDSEQDAYNHVYLLHKALTAIPYNSIFVCVRFEPNISSIKKQIDIQYNLIKHFERNLVVVVTHMDLAENIRRDNEIIEALQTDPRNRLNVMILSKNSCPVSIASAMFSIIDSMDALPIAVEFDTFLISLNLSQFISTCRDAFKKYQHSVHYTREQFDSLALQGKNAFSVSDQLDDYLHALAVEFKNVLQRMKECFEEEFGPAMTELDLFVFHTDLQTLILNEANSFSNSIWSFMSSPFGDKSDPRNLIKRCPACKLVWVKVEGCDGATSCGNRCKSSDRYKNKSRPWYRFRFIKDSIRNVWSWTTNTEPPVSKEPTPRTEESKIQGCGAKLIWKDLPRLEEADIIELMQVTSFEEVKEIIKIPHFARVRQVQNKTIEAEFIPMSSRPGSAFH